MTASRLPGEPTFRGGFAGVFIGGPFGGECGEAKAGAGSTPAPAQGLSGGGGHSAQNLQVGLLTGVQVVGLAVGGRRPGGLAGGQAGGDGVVAHRGGDLGGPQTHPAASFTGVLVHPDVGGQVVGDDGHPVALVNRGRGAAGQHAVGGDLHPAGDLAPTVAAGGQVEGQAQLDAGDIVADGEGAGVIAHAAGDGDV